MIHARWLTLPQDCWEAALFTQGKEPLKGMTVDQFRKLIKAEHSPIRSAILRIYLYGIPDRVSVHLVRHVHSLHFVKTNRPDLTGIERPPTTNHMIDVNVEGLLSIARKRLCKKAMKETRDVVMDIRNFLCMSDDKYMNLVGDMMVRNCIYFGECREIKKCQN